MTATRCEDCGRSTRRRYARYCAEHRWRHRLKRSIYVFDAVKDAYLREHYSLERRCSQRIGALWGYPAWSVRRRAIRLGLTREGVRAKPWTPEETRIVQRYASHRDPGWIAQKVQRTLTAVVVRIKRLGLSRRPDGYTAGQVAEGLGVERGTVERWVRQGWLRTAHVPRPGQSFAFTEAEIAAFLRGYRSAYDLRKVDQLWFLDLVFDGEIGQKAKAAA